MSPRITHIDPEETIRKLKAKVARLEKAMAEQPAPVQQEPENPDEVGMGCECANCANGMGECQPAQQEPVAWVTVEKGVVTTRSANFSHISDGQYQLYAGPLQNDVVAAIATLKALGYVYNESKTCQEGEQWIAPQPAQLDIERLTALVRAQQITIDKLEAQRKPLTKQERDFIHAATGSIKFFKAVEHAITQTEAAHGIKDQP